MALPPDDWVSTSPIAAPAPGRIAAVTPGRALTREEVRQQRRRGNPAPNTKKTDLRVQPDQISDTAQDRATAAGTSNEGAHAGSHAEKPRLPAVQPQTRSSPTSFVSSAGKQMVDSTKQREAEPAAINASTVVPSTLTSKKVNSSSADEIKSPARPDSTRNDADTAVANAIRDEAPRRAPFDSSSPEQADPPSSEAEGESERDSRQKASLPLFRPASSPQISPRRASPAGDNARAVSRSPVQKESLVQRDSITPDLGKANGENGSAASKVSKENAIRPAKKTKKRVPETRDDRSLTKEDQSKKVATSKANGSKRMREEDNLEELQAVEAQTKPKKTKHTPTRTPGDLISVSVQHIKSVIQRMRSHHKDNTDLRKAFGRIKSGIESHATELLKASNQRNELRNEGERLRAWQAELEARLSTLDSQRADIARDLQKEEVLWRQSRRQLKITLAVHEKGILLEDDTTEPEEISGTVESKLLSLMAHFR